MSHSHGSLQGHSFSSDQALEEKAGEPKVSHLLEHVYKLLHAANERAATLETRLEKLDSRLLGGGRPGQTEEDGNAKPAGLIGEITASLERLNGTLTDIGAIVDELERI